MRNLTSIFAVVTLGALAQTAEATYIVDTTTFGPSGITSNPDGKPTVLDGYGFGDVNKLDGTLDFVSWTHKFTIPSNGHLTSGVLSLKLEDDSTTDGIEIGFGFTDSWQWDVGVVSTQTYKYDVALKSLLDGSLSITLMSLFGDFLVKSSELRIGYTSVPEPATLSLLGLGVLSAALGYRRRRAKKT